MWPFKRKKQTSTEIQYVEKKKDNDQFISCFVKGLGVMICSSDYKWDHKSNIFSSYFECKSEDISMTLDYNYSSKEYELKSLIFSSQGGIKKKEEDYLIQKLIERFPDTSIQKRKDEEDKAQQKLDRISKLGCPQKT